MIAFRPDRLRDARRARGWTMRQLRARTGISITTISLVESGRHVPTVTLLLVWLNALNLRADLVLVIDQPTPARPGPAEDEPPLF